jgi:hypothetical protein
MHEHINPSLRLSILSLAAEGVRQASYEQKQSPFHREGPSRFREYYMLKK